MEQATWAAALEPVANRLGVMFANLGTVALFVISISFLVACMAGGARKQMEREPGRYAPRARGRAFRVLLKPLARGQRKDRSLWL